MLDMFEFNDYNCDESHIIIAFVAKIKERMISWKQKI